MKTGNKHGTENYNSESISFVFLKRSLSKINHVGTTINCTSKGRNTTLLSLYVCCEFVRRFNGQINMFVFVWIAIPAGSLICESELRIRKNGAHMLTLQVQFHKFAFPMNGLLRWILCCSPWKCIVKYNIIYLLLTLFIIFGRIAVHISTTSNIFVFGHCSHSMSSNITATMHVVYLWVISIRVW